MYIRAVAPISMLRLSDTVWRPYRAVRWGGRPHRGPLPTEVSPMDGQMCRFTGRRFTQFPLCGTGRETGQISGRSGQGSVIDEGLVPRGTRK